MKGSKGDLARLQHIHEYFGIDLNIAWEIIEFDIPELKTKIFEILGKMK